MNLSQFLSLLRSIIKYVSGAAVAHGYASQSSAEFWGGIVFGVGVLVWSHYTHADPKEVQANLPGLSLVLICFIPVFVGCSTIHTHMEVTEPNGQRRITDTQGRTFFDAKSALSKWTTSNAEKTQRSGIEGLAQESSGSNATHIVVEIAGAVAKP
jgi:hypothetical protein